MFRRMMHGITGRACYTWIFRFEQLSEDSSATGFGLQYQSTANQSLQEVSK